MRGASPRGRKGRGRGSAQLTAGIRRGVRRYCGASMGPLKGMHFSSHHLEEMGRLFCEVLLEYGDAESVEVGKLEC